MTGDNIELTFAGQRVTGSFAFESAKVGTAKVVRVLITGLSADFGDGTTSFVTLRDGFGFFLLGDPDGTAGPKTGGLAGEIGGTVSVNIPGIGLKGDFKLALNTTAAEVSETISFGPTHRELAGDRVRRRQRRRQGRPDRRPHRRHPDRARRRLGLALRQPARRARWRTTT